MAAPIIRRCHIRHTLTHHIANSPTENSPNIFSTYGKFIHGYFNHGYSTHMQLRHPLSVTASYGIKKNINHNVKSEDSILYLLKSKYEMNGNLLTIYLETFTVTGKQTLVQNKGNLSTFRIQHI